MVSVSYKFSEIRVCALVAFSASVDFSLPIKRRSAVVAWLYVVLAVAARTSRQCLKMLDIVFA